MNLSPDQTKAYQAIGGALSMGSQGVFVTGKAGTGKSVLLREVRDDYRLPVLAPTGLAAINVGGQTIHSFFGIRPGDITKSTLKDSALKILRKSPGFLIDEISMVRADLLDQVDRMCRKSLKDDRPFGGKTVVMFGDPWQIEPVVSTDGEREYLNHHYRSPFFFDSKVYGAMQVSSAELTHVFRQEGDTRFRDALNRIRIGHSDTLPIFNEAAGRDPKPHVLRLTMTNAKASAINDQKLRSIQAPHTKYEGCLRGEFGRELPAEQVLLLKVGARVMIVSNSKEYGYFNGDMGTVTGLATDEVSVVLDRNGQTVRVRRNKWERLAYNFDESEEKMTVEVVADYTQMPLKLGWATTIHKSQGQTYDLVHLELERNPHSHGMTYVGLSRCRTLAGLTLGRKLTHQDVVFNQRVLGWYQTMFGSDHL